MRCSMPIKLRNLLSYGLLRWDTLLRKRHVFVGVNSIASRINDGRRHKDDKILLLCARRLAPEEATCQWQVSKDGNFVFGFCYVLRDQTSQHHRLAIPDNRAGHHLAKSEIRERRDLRQRSGSRPDTSYRLSLCLKELGGIRIVTKKLLYRRDNGHLDCIAVSRDVRNYVQNRS